MSDRAADRGTDSERDGSTRADDVPGPLAATPDVSVDALRRVLSRAGPSAWTAAVSTTAGALLLGWVLVGLPLAALSLVAGVGLAAGVVALNARRGVVLVAGGAVMVPGGLLAATVLGLAAFHGFASGPGLVGHLTEASVLLVVVAGFAGTLSLSPRPASALVGAAFSRFVAALVPFSVVQVLLVALALRRRTAVFLADLVVDSPEPLLAVGRVLLAPTGRVALPTFLLGAVLLAVTAARTLRALPVVALAPPNHRARLDRRLRRTAAVLDRVALLTVGGSVVVYGLALALGADTPARMVATLGPSVGGVLATAVTATVPRVVALLVLGVLGAMLLAEQVRRRSRTVTRAALVRYSLPVVGAALGAVAVAAVASLAVSPSSVVAALPAAAGPVAGAVTGLGIFPLTLIAAFAGLVVVGFLLLGVSGLVSVSLLPRRATAAALAAVALFGAALAVAVVGGPVPVAAAGAVLAMVAWDAGEFAVGLREELDAAATTTRGELVHLGAAAAVGIAGFAAAVLTAGLVGSGWLAVTSATALTGTVLVALALLILALAVPLEG
jgi:hypothetical protein